MLAALSIEQSSPSAWFGVGVLHRFWRSQAIHSIPSRRDWLMQPFTASRYNK